MDLVLVLVLYAVGLGLIIAESMLPGIVIGVVGAALVATSVYFGFGHHWSVGTIQLALALVVGPLAFFVGLRKLAMKATLTESSFGRDHSEFEGREGVAVTDLRPAGNALIDGRKVDVVTGGDLIARGRRVRVVRVEGNRVVVKAI
jgi:membrane-bound serine protease (ClpP class)